MRDYVFIEELKVDCVIGFAAWERMVEQTVVIDLRLGVDVVHAAQKDRVDPGDFDTKALSRKLKQFVAETKFQLIETLAQRVADLILTEFPVAWLELRLSKPGALRGASNVGVQIFRERSVKP